MNILCTSAGRRGYLIRYFRAALGTAGKVYAADASAGAIALQDAEESFLLPWAHEADFVEVLLESCLRRQITAVIPLNDLELPVLASNRDVFRDRGITIVVSPSEVIDTCLDKWAAFLFLRAHGVSTPETSRGLAAARAALESGRMRYPLVLKPRWGSASVDVEFVFDPQDLDPTYRMLEKRLARRRPMARRTHAGDTTLVQQMVEGREYGLDVVNDLEGRYHATLVKEKIRMRAGETDRAITCEDEQLERLGRSLGDALRHVGNLDCDVMVHGDQAYVVDMNPRFGGGYPFCHLAGADLPAAILAWLGGSEPGPDMLKYEPGVESAKSVVPAVIRPADDI